jgi:NAD(P)-dependent dehydrogenase (short-subunit alcohol dehydrogenase family)
MQCYCVCACAGINGFAGITPYAASKHAVVGMMRCAAAEYGPLGLRINAINPGAVGKPLGSAISALALQSCLLCAPSVCSWRTWDPGHAAL